MSAQEPLIKNQESYEYVEKSRFLVKFTKWVLKFAMCLVFVCWVGFLLLLPSESVSGLAENFVEDSSGSVFWVSGFFLFFLNYIILWVIEIWNHKFEKAKK